MVWQQFKVGHFLAFKDFGLRHWKPIGYQICQDWIFCTKEDQESPSIADVNEVEWDGGKATGPEAYGPGLYFFNFS